MDETRPTANPINPAGIPRGPAKPDVYRILMRLDKEGLHEFEREELERRRGESGLRLPPLPTGKRPSGQIIAEALFLEADLREWLGEGPDERQRRILDARDAGHITDEQSDALLEQVWKDESDRRRWAGVLLTASLAARCWPSGADAELLRKLDAGDDVELPPDLEREADKHVERERRRNRGFRRQLGKLREQSPLEQGRTIADWRRNAKKASSKGTVRLLPF